MSPAGFRKRPSPKTGEWSHLTPTQKRCKSRGLHCLSVSYYQSICMPQSKWPMKTAFPITNRWVWFHWILARNYPKTRNLHFHRIQSQQWIVLLRFKWCFMFSHRRHSRNRCSVNRSLSGCEIARNREVRILFQWVDVDSFSRLGWSNLWWVLLFLILRIISFNPDSDNVFETSLRCFSEASKLRSWTRLSQFIHITLR
jgi:hypothetical protein